MIVKNQYAIIDCVSNRVLVTSYNEQLLKMVYDSGFKTRWNVYKIMKI